jgi:hypothetical protein
MKKKNKIKAGKKTTLLGGAAKSLKKMRKGAANGLGGLSATQKVVGGAALVALGLTYLNKRRGNAAAAIDTPADITGAEENLAALDVSEA